MSKERFIKSIALWDEFITIYWLTTRLPAAAVESFLGGGLSISRSVRVKAFVVGGGYQV
jgi:hypothetical protein